MLHIRYFYTTSPASKNRNGLFQVLIKTITTTIFQWFGRDIDKYFTSSYLDSKVISIAIYEENYIDIEQPVQERWFTYEIAQMMHFFFL